MAMRASDESNDLKLQLELARDIEDWDKYHQIEAQLNKLEQGLVPAPPQGGGYGSGGGRPEHQAWGAAGPRRSRSPPKRGGRNWDGRQNRQQNLDWWQVPAQPTENPVVIEYNKSIKHHLQKGNIQAARHVLAEMQYTRVWPTAVTYNEFLNYYAKCKDIRESLRVIGEMRRQGINPNRVSASTILKALQEKPTRDQVDEVVSILKWVSSIEGMDEILLSSMAEATVRMGQHASRLYAVLRRELEENEGAAWSAQTCGSLIRAHGHTKDVDGMWKMWNNMMSHMIRPTVVTTGCMVEQLVLNGQVHDACDLVRKLEMSSCSECVNSVVYYSLIKGFAMEKDGEKVWKIYTDMRNRRLQTSVTTYNGLVGAFSECGLVDKVNLLFAHMKSEGLAPTVCTYSRLAKGYCMRGDVKQAFEVMNQMTALTGMKPDEIFYNTLLDCCAERGMVEDGLQLLERMEQDGVASSKYTLSILAKLFVRVGRVADALHHVEQLSQRHRLEISLNIYTTLLGACSEAKDQEVAVSMLKTLISRGSRPDRRAFSGLLKRFLLLVGPPANTREAVRAVLDAMGSPRSLQAVLDRGVLQEALTQRAQSGGVEEVRPLLEVLERATDGGFWFDLDAAVRDPGRPRSLARGEQPACIRSLPPPPPPPAHATSSSDGLRGREEASRVVPPPPPPVNGTADERGGNSLRDRRERERSRSSPYVSRSRSAGRGPVPTQRRASGSPAARGGKGGPRRGASRSPDARGGKGGYRRGASGSPDSRAGRSGYRRGASGSPVARGGKGGSRRGASGSPDARGGKGGHRRGASGSPEARGGKGAPWSRNDMHGRPRSPPAGRGGRDSSRPRSPPGVRGGRDSRPRSPPGGRGAHNRSRSATPPWRTRGQSRSFSGLDSCRGSAR